jgi:hypothetical protein
MNSQQVSHDSLENGETVFDKILKNEHYDKILFDKILFDKIYDVKTNNKTYQCRIRYLSKNNYGSYFYQLYLVDSQKAIGQIQIHCDQKGEILFVRRLDNFYTDQYSYVGTSLIEFAKLLCKTLGKKSIRLESTWNAVAFYLCIGFKIEHDYYMQETDLLNDKSVPGYYDCDWVDKIETESERLDNEKYVNKSKVLRSEHIMKHVKLYRDKGLKIPKSIDFGSITMYFNI